MYGGVILSVLRVVLKLRLRWGWTEWVALLLRLLSLVTQVRRPEFPARDKGVRKKNNKNTTTTTKKHTTTKDRDALSKILINFPNQQQHILVIT